MATCPTCRLKFDEGVETCPEDGETLLPDEAFTNVDDALKEGEVVDDYAIGGQIGAGTYGTVYRAEHKVIGKRAALKVLNRRFSSDPHIVSRFIAEARAVNMIGHPNIVDIFAFGTLDDGRQYLAMELLEGESLGERLERGGPLDIPTALPILKQVADALDAAHEAGIAHRDLKPDNVFLAKARGDRLHTKLLDFGVAKLQGEQVGHKTATGMTIGTPLYMSPEQVRGKKVTTKADLYAFGCVVYEVLVGAPPFIDETIVEVMMHHVNTPPPAASAHQPSLPSEIDAPIEALLAKVASQRPESAFAAMAAFEEAYKQSLLPKAAKDTARAGTPDAAAGIPFEATQQLEADGQELAAAQAHLERTEQAKTAALPSPTGDAPRPGERAPEAGGPATGSTLDAVHSSAASDTLSTRAGESSRGARWAVAIAAVLLGGAAVAFVSLGGSEPGDGQTQAGPAGAPVADVPTGDEGREADTEDEEETAADASADDAEAAPDDASDAPVPAASSAAPAPPPPPAATPPAAPPRPVAVPSPPPPPAPPPPPPAGDAPLFTDRD